MWDRLDEFSLERQLRQITSRDLWTLDSERSYALLCRANTKTARLRPAASRCDTRCIECPTRCMNDCSEEKTARLRAKAAVLCWA
jgi:hypothetical protein